MNAPLLPEARVNSFIAGVQSDPQVTTLVDGSYVVVWQSVGQDGDLDGIFGQRFSAQGQRIGAEFLVNETSREDQQDPSIAATDDGGFVVVWEARNQDNPPDFDYGVFGRRFNADATPASGEFQINSVNVAATQFDASVAGIPGGGFAVAFTDDFGDSNSDGIRVRFFDAAGVPTGADVQVNTDEISNQGDAEIAAIQASAGPNGLAAGGVVVVWTDPSDGSSNGIRAQVYNAAGVAVGGEIAVNTTTSSSQQDSVAAGLTGGRFVVVWQDHSGSDGSGIGVVGRVFEGDGTPASAEFQVNQEFSSSQFAPSVVGTTDGGFVVTWTSNTSGSAGDGSSTGIFSRRFDADGVAVTDEALVNETTLNEQSSSSVSALANGDFVTVWQSNDGGDPGNLVSPNGIFQRLAGDPMAFVAPGIAPEIEAVSTSRTFVEDDFDAGPLRIDIDGAAAVSDIDSADFDGGRLIVTNLAQSVAEDEFPAQDADEQDNIGFDTSAGSRVAITGPNVSVDGVVIGVLASDGQAGAQLLLNLNADSNAEVVEVLIEHLTYQNVSDDPRPNTTLGIYLEDGDGSSAEPVLVDIEVLPSMDINGPVRDEVRVNTVTANVQDDPEVATLYDPISGDAVGYVVVWDSEAQDAASDTGVFAQRYDIDGAPVGDEFQVNQTVNFTQFDADVAGLADGGFVIVWTDDLGDPSGDGIRLTRYDANGVPVAGQIEVVVNTETGSNQSQAQVAALSDGGYQVIWTSPTSGSAGDGNSNGLFTQRYNALGATVGGEQQVNEQTEGSQSSGEIAALDAGRFVAVWQSATSGAAGDGSSNGIFGRLFNNMGLPEGGEFQVNATAAGSQTDPQVATLANGNFVVVWRSEGQDTNSGGIYGQVFSNLGVAINSEFRINDAFSGDQTQPTLIALENGGFVVGFVDTSTPAPGSGSDVFTQVFDADGTRLDTQVLVNTDVAGTQQNPSLAPLSGGDYVAVWQTAANGTDISQQIFGDPANFSISDAPEIIGLPNVVTIAENDANTGALLVPSQAISLIDDDSPDFDGGRLLITRVVVDVNGDDFNAPDDNAQDNLFVDDVGTVTVVGTDVRVSGVTVGQLNSNGQDGADLDIAFNASADIAAVEAVLRALTYQNDSDNPRGSREYNVELTDGDGSIEDPFALTINLTQDADPGAAAPIAGEMQVNTFITGTQNDASVAALNDGGWVVVWQSANQDGSGNGVYGQRYEADGQLTSPEFKINATNFSDQSDPVVAALSDGGFVVLWEARFSDTPTTNDFGIVGQRYDAMGAPAGGEFIVNTTTSLTQFDPAVIGLPTGGFVAAWTSDTGDGSNDGVAYQRYDAAGAPVGSEIFVNEQTSSDQTQADLAILSTGQTIVVWTSANSGAAGDGNSNGVFGRVVNADGTFAGGEFQINQQISGSQSEPSVAATATGFVVAWTDASGQDGSSNGVQARFFDNAGAATGDEFTVNELRTNSQSTPDVAILSDDRVLISFGANGEVAGQLFAATGERIDGEFQINTQTSSTQARVQVAALPDGNFVAVWDSLTSAGAGDGDAAGIFQQLFGDPSDFNLDAPNMILGLPGEVTFDEADVNASLVRIDPDKTAAAPDLGVTNFDGGVLQASIDLIDSRIEQRNAPDDGQQHQLGLVSGDVGNGGVTFSGLGVGGTVSVDGVVVGAVSADGLNGGPFAVTFNAMADVEAVEAVLGNLAYGNSSNDPDPLRIAINLDNGAGVASQTAFIDVDFTPEADLGLTVGDERRVNAHTQEIQESPEIVELTGGGHVVVWQSRNQDELPANNFDYGVYAQVYDANGVPMGPEVQVNTTTVFTQIDPAVAATSDGGFVVTWTGDAQDDLPSTDMGVIAQRFDATGAAVGGEIIVNTTVVNSQFDSSVSGFVDGGFVVSYVSDSGDGAADAILSQRFDAAGAMVGVEVVVNTTTTGNQSQPEVATLTSGGGATNAGHVVVWTDPSADGDSSSVRGRLFDAAGNPAAADFQVNTSTAGGQSLAKAAGLLGGGFVVVWNDSQNDSGSNGVFAQMYNGAGAAVGGEFVVNDTVASSQSRPEVVGLSNGGFAVSWEGSGPGDASGVFVQAFDAAGARVDGEMRVNVETSSTQAESSIASATGGGFIVAYQAETSGNSGDGSSRGVFLREFESAPAASTSPELSDAARIVTLGADDVSAGPVIIDNNVRLEDPDGGTFDGGALMAYYTGGPVATDQLSIVSAGPITVAGAVVNHNGVQIGTIDGTLNGVNGAGLKVDFNAMADVDGVRLVLERLAFSTTDLAANIANTDRGVGIVISDGAGGQTEPDSFFLDINTGSIAPTGLAIGDFGLTENGAAQNFGPFDHSALIAAPVLIDDAIDFDDFAGTSFNGGFVRLDEIGASDARQQLSVENQGAGPHQIGFDGTNVNFGGVMIGTVDGTANGVDGADLQINLNASATSESVDALLEAFTFGLSGATADFNPDLQLSVRNQAGATGTSAGRVLNINDDLVQPSPTDGEQQVNSFSFDEQVSPRVSATADGGYVVVWTSEQQDNPAASNERGVFAQRYNAFGEEVGNEFRINDQAFGDQFQPRVTALDNGNFVGLWLENNGRDGSGQGVFGRLFDANGDPLGGAFQVNEETSSNQNSGEIADLGGGRFLGVWSSQTSGGAGDGSSTGIFGRTFDATGAAEGAEFQINTSTVGTQNRPRMTTLPDGDVIVVWQDEGGNDGNSSGVFAQRIDATGALVNFDGTAAGAGSTEMQINTTTSGSQNRPDVAALSASATLPGGGFAFVWESPDGFSDGVFAQVYDINGVAVGGELQINQRTVNNQSDAVPIGTADGGFMVAFRDDSGVDGSGVGVVAQRVNADGTLNGLPFIVPEQILSTQDQPELATLANGSVVAVWRSLTSGTAGDGSGSGIFQTIIDPAATPPGGMSPALVGFDVEVTFDEAVVNGGPQLLHPDNVLSLTDMDSANFDGGSVLLSRLDGSASIFDEQLGAPDDATQDNVSIIDGNGVTVVAGVVSVGGTAIGMIVQDGADGAPLEISLNAMATPEAVEAVVGRVGYSNPSSVPSAGRQYSIQITDGDGGSTGTQLVTINVTPDDDLMVTSAGADRQVNTFIAGVQTNSQVATLYDDVTGDANGYVIVWQSADQDRPQDASPGVFGQIYDLNGNAVGGEFQVNTHTEFAQDFPVVTGLMGGGFVAAWEDNSFASPAGLAAGDTDHAVLAQVFDAVGAKVGPEFIVNEETSSTQDRPALTSLADGGFVATWTSISSGAAGDGSGDAVLGRVFNADGTPRAGEFVVNQTTVNSQNLSDVAQLADGNLVFVWSSNLQDNAPANDNGVFARVVDATGGNVVSEFQVNTFVSGSQTDPHVAALTGGDFVVVWETQFAQDGSGWGTFQQRFQADGTPVGTESRVNFNTINSQFDPAITALDNGGWIVTFTDDSGADGSGSGVFAQAFAADGSRVDGNFQVNTETSSTQNISSVAALNGDEFVVSFSSFTSGTAGDGSSTGVFQQLFKSAGAPVGSTAPDVQGLPGTIVFDEADLNANAQQLFPNAAVGDADSANFEGGALIIAMVQNDVVQAQFSPPDNAEQDQLSFDTSAATTVTVVGSNVSVGGVLIGQLVSDGQNGADLAVQLNASATPQAIETLLEAAQYANISDDPETSRLISVAVTDGDGGVFNDVVGVTITPEADAARPVGDEVQTNSFTAGTQTDSTTASLFDPVTGDVVGYVVAWTSNNQDATGDSNNGVFAQMYDASGAPVGGEFQVNTTTLASQSNPQAIGLSTGGFAITWQDNSGLPGGTGRPEVMTQVYDANGQEVGGEILVGTDGLNQANPAIDSFDNGDFVIVRQAQDDQSPFQTTIVGQRFNDAGGTVGIQFEIEDLGNIALVNPDVAVLNDGKFIVVYQASNIDNPGGFDAGVFGQLYAANGSEIGTTFQINTRERFNQDLPRVAATADGGFAVVYQSNFNDDFGFTNSPGVYVQRFDDMASAVGDEMLVNEIVDNSQTTPDILGLPGGGFTIVYADNNGTDGSGWGVFSQSYNAAGERLDGRVQINQETSSTQNLPSIAGLNNGDYVVSWDSATSGTAGDGSASGIFHRLVGDPANFGGNAGPVLDGLRSEITFDENTVNGVPQLIDSNGASAVSDSDSADFDGGSLLVSNVIASAPLIDQINPPDDLSQDVLGLRQDSRVSITGSDVSVDGVVVGQIVQDGAAGRPFELGLNANATPEVTEVLVEHLTYRNVSDDPLPMRQLRIQLTDGDGGASEPVLISVRINPTVDAAIPFGGENQANTTTIGAQDTPSIATLANGDFIIAWDSNGQDGSGEGVFAQRIDPLGNHVAPDGSPLMGGASGEFQVNTSTTNSQFDSSVIGLPDGGFIINWTNNSGLDGSGNGVFGQRFDASGATVGGEFQVNTLTSSNQDQSDVTALMGPNAGKWVSVWHSETSAGAGDGNGSGVIGQIFEADGTTPTGEFVINTETLSEQDAPQLIALADGGFFAVWQSTSTTFDPMVGTIPPTADGSSNGVFGQRFDATGAAAGAEVQINATTLNNQFDPQVAALNNGNLAIVWTDNAADGSVAGVYGRIIGPDGAPVTDEFRVNDQRINSQTMPDVVALTTGGFAVVWDDNNGTDGSGVGVFAQQYSDDGNRIDSQFQVNTEFSGNQFQPVITALADGGFAIAWTSQTSGSAGDGNSNGVFYQIFANAAPTVSPVSAEGDEDTAIVLDESVFEAGFVDPDGQTLQAIRIETLPTQGALMVNGSPAFAGQEVSIAQLLAGELVYQGNLNFFGSDQFLWTGSDGISFAPGLVEAEITVNPVNDAPGLEAGPDDTIAEGQFFNRQLMLSDPDADSRSFTVDFGDGSALVNFNSSSLMPNINHTFGAEGMFTVTVTVDDNAGEANSVEMDSFVVTVENAPPNATNDIVNVSEDAPSAPFDPLSDDSDPGGDPIMLTMVNGGAFMTGVPVVLASGATVTVDGGGNFVYDPNGQFEALDSFDTGIDSFTYTIEDDAGLSDTATVTVFIDGQNDAPVAQDDDLTANSDTAIVENVLVDNGNGVDDDVDGSSSLSVFAINGVEADVGMSITLPSGAMATLDANGDLAYDPTTLPSGTTSDSFQYTLTDGLGGFDTATVNITINVLNVAPDAMDDNVSTDEDTLLSGDVLVDNGNGADSDGDGDALTVVAVNGDAADVGMTVTLLSGALLTVNSDGTFDYDPNGQFEMLPVGGSGMEAFTYTISDGNGGTDTATVTVTVDGVNDDPVAGSVGGAAFEDGPPTMGDVLTNTTDIDMGDMPVVSEVNGSALAVGMTITLPSGATINIASDGSYTYDPNGAFESLGDMALDTDVIGFTVSDGNGGSDSSFLSIQVTGQNDAPVAQDDAFMIAEGATLNDDVFADNGSGIDDDVDNGDVINVLSVNGETADVDTQITLPSGALLMLNSDGTFEYDQNGQFESLNSGDNGADSFTYTITDVLGETSTATANITIIGDADAPTAEDDGFSIGENDTLVDDLFADNGSGPDSDPEGDTLTITEVNGMAGNVGGPILLPSGATLTVGGAAGDGGFTYDPGLTFDSLPFGAMTTDTFTYTIDDGVGGTDTATVTIDINGENDDPVAQDDTLGVNEDDVQLTDNLFQNNGSGADDDIDGDSFTVTSVDGMAMNVGMEFALASGALLTVDANGDITYRPNGQFEFLSVTDTATDTFTYTIEDVNGGTDMATVDVVVQGENDQPTANDDSFDVIVTQMFMGNVIDGVNSAADSDPDLNDVLSVIELNGSGMGLGGPVVLPSGATVTLNSTGAFTYDPTTATFMPPPAVGSPVSDSFQYTISDGVGGSSTGTVNILVQPEGNTAPVAQDDSVSTNEDTNVLGDVLVDNGNGADSDVDGDMLTVTAVNGVGPDVGMQITLPSGALLTLNGDGTFDYDPNDQFESLAVGGSTTDTFDYTISDGNGGSDTGTVTIDIDGVNDAPDARDDVVSTDEDNAVSGDVLVDNGDGADSDIDGDTLTVTAVNGDAMDVGMQITLPSGALLTLNSDGTFDYDPNGQFESLPVGGSATDTFDYTISDGNGGTDTATVTIDIDGVNDDPDARDDSISTDEDNAVSGDVLVDNGDGADSDIDGDGLTVSEVNGEAGDVDVQITLPSGALLTLNSDGTFDYDPNGQFESLPVGGSATDTFDYTISDGNGGTDTATVTIDIDGVNDDPDARDDSISTDEDNAVSGDVLVDNGDGADSDIDGDGLTVSEVNGEAGDVDVQITLPSGALLTLNSDGTFDYDPNGQFESLPVGGSATDTFDYTISDGNGGTDTATVTIDIDGVNDDPIAQDDDVLTDEDNGVSSNVLGDNGNGVDDDIDGDALTVTEVNGNSGNVGSQIMLLSGALLMLNSDGSFDYDPNGAFEGLGVGDAATDTFAYTISDGNGGTDTATVTVDIDGVNDDPDARDDSVSTAVDVALIGGDVFADNGDGADSDVDGDPLTVTEVNGAAMDVGNQITLASGALLTLNADGTFDYDPTTATFMPPPASGMPASDSFQYTISDGNGGTDTATVTIAVQPSGNTPPVARDDDVLTDEDNAVSGDVLADNGGGADSDVDGDPLTVTEVDGNAGDVGNQIVLASGALLTVNGDGTFDYDPNDQFEDLAVGASAMDTFDYTISEGNGGTDTATVTITIDGVNDDPVAQDDAVSTDEDNAVAGDVLVDNSNGADSDIDGDALTVSEVNGSSGDVGNQITLASGALVTLNADGTFDYDPNGQYEALNVGDQATDTFQYTISDGNGGTDTATVTVTIDGVNDDPIAQDDDVGTDEDNAVSGDVLVDNGNGADSDVDGGALTVTEVNGMAGDVGSQVTLASGALLTLNSDGTFDYDPNSQFEALNAGDQATDSFEYTISDGNGGTDTAIVTVTIDGVDDVGGPLIIDGTPGFDRLMGTAADEIFRSQGGVVDQMFSNGGADIFEFGAETSNGVFERDYIYGFNADDRLDLGGATIATEINSPFATTLFLSGDGDAIYLIGVADFDETTQLV